MACETLAQKFHTDCYGGYDGLLQDLISLVLNDDGSDLVVLGSLPDANRFDGDAIANQNDGINPDQDQLIHYILRQDGHLITSRRERYAVSILSQYCHDKGSALLTWTKLKIRQHHKIKRIFKELGVLIQTDWGILNQLNSAPIKLGKLSERSRQIVQVYHEVYRRDRRRTAQKGTCTIPSESQLQEMCDRFSKIGNYPELITSDLLSELQEIARQVRDMNRPKVLSTDCDNASHLQRHKGFYLEKTIFASHEKNTVEKIQDEDTRSLIAQAKVEALTYGIKQGIQHQRQALLKGRRSAMEPLYIPGLRLCYCEGQSTRQIADQFKLPQPKVSRVLKLETLLQQVKHYTTENFLDSVVSLSQSLEPIHTSPKILDNVIQEAQSFLEVEIFDPAYKELKAGKNRRFDSLYSQYLRRHLTREI
ncbi:MAG: hypothetical protein AB4042_09125 [Leptolyngbyaceae cyanobacterium]